MKHLHLFEDFTKLMVESVTLEEFKTLKKGQPVKYMGTPYIVETPGDNEISLKDDDDNIIEVNYNMFKMKGMITQN